MTIDQFADTLELLTTAILQLDKERIIKKPERESLEYLFDALKNSRRDKKRTNGWLKQDK